MDVCPYTDATLQSSLKLCIPFRVHLFGSFYRPKWPIFLPFQILQLVKSPPFHTPEAWKRCYFLSEPTDPCNGHYGRTFASRRYHGYAAVFRVVTQSSSPRCVTPQKRLCSRLPLPRLLKNTIWSVSQTNFLLHFLYPVCSTVQRYGESMTKEISTPGEKILLRKLISSFVNSH